MQRVAVSIFVALVASLHLVACDIPDGDEANSTVSEAVSTNVPPATTLPQGVSGIALPITTTVSNTTVTIWIPLESATFAEADSTLYADQLQAYDEAHPDVTISVEQKPIEGQGGILSYLRTARNVAPSILPDIIVLPTDHLTTAASEDLVFPLDNLVDPSLFADLFPVSLSLVRPDEQTIGIPITLTDLHHLVYNSNVITDTLPLIWNNLASQSEQDFVFPASGKEGAVLALQFYLALGGEVTSETGQPLLELEPLTMALELFRQGREGNFVDLQSSNIADLDETWQHFQSGSAVLAQTTADLFLRKRSPELATGFSPLPGPDGALSPLVRGWAWALTAPEPGKRALAAEMLSALVSESGIGVWSYQSGILPPWRNAFSHWPPDDPYTIFLQQELERAQVFPTAGIALLPALGDAVFDVTSLSLSSREAAEAAVAAVRP